MLGSMHAPLEFCLSKFPLLISLLAPLKFQLWVCNRNGHGQKPLERRLFYECTCKNQSSGFSGRFQSRCKIEPDYQGGENSLSIRHKLTPSLETFWILRCEQRYLEGFSNSLWTEFWLWSWYFWQSFRQWIRFWNWEQQTQAHERTSTYWWDWHIFRYPEANWYAIFKYHKIPNLLGGLKSWWSWRQKFFFKIFLKQKF